MNTDLVSTLALRKLRRFVGLPSTVSSPSSPEPRRDKRMPCCGVDEGSSVVDDAVPASRSCTTTLSQDCARYRATPVMVSRLLGIWMFIVDVIDGVPRAGDAVDESGFCLLLAVRCCRATTVLRRARKLASFRRTDSSARMRLYAHRQLQLNQTNR